MLLLTSIIMYIDFSQCWAPTIPSQLCPLILVVILLSILLCPLRLFYLSGRQWLGVTLGRIALSGLLPVEFRDFFVADELNSMAFSLWMGVYFFCVYTWHWNDLDIHCNVPKMTVTPFLASLPPLWRGLQCLRRYHDSKEKHHLVNGLKYVTSIMATMLAGVRRISRKFTSPAVEAFWVLVSIINSSYTSIWDIKMDWGLLDVNSNHFLLRDDLVFDKWTYYVAIPLNILLRFSWAINKASLAYHSQVITFATAILEVIRRIVWNFFRLENEHLNNCGNYRAIKEIPLPFALKETYKLSGSEEEGTVQLPLDQGDRSSPSSFGTAHTVSNSHGNTSTDVLPVTSPDLGGMLETPIGSFYGRRDFETRQEKDDGKLGAPVRQSTMVGQVLDRIRTLGTPEESDSEADDDDSD
ncbi:EXS family-domain-containing protein [Absidia repens]|uniref:EXS family-domain-containing protein n=1 Tax=Absidia repens TaxID=90262 RepID=A0A1X2IXA6_9FUNG|nr:EXS family-domain-containing protein [Absidia repens]